VFDDDIYNGIIETKIEKYVTVNALDQSIALDKGKETRNASSNSSSVGMSSASFRSTGKLDRQIMLNDVLSDEDDNDAKGFVKPKSVLSSRADSIEDAHGSKLKKILEVAVNSSTLDRHSFGGTPANNIFAGYSASLPAHGQVMGKGSYDEYSNIDYYEVQVVDRTIHYSSNKFVIVANAIFEIWRMNLLQLNIYLLLVFEKYKLDV
jgi:hypothetical protein